VDADDDADDDVDEEDAVRVVELSDGGNKEE
jgi:hypothetical protein